MTTSAMPELGTTRNDLKLIECIDPATLEVIGRVPEWSAQMVSAAIARARKAQPGWSALGFRGRAQYLRRVQESISERAAELAAVITRNSGKPLVESLSSDIVPVLYLLRYFLAEGEKMLAPEPVNLGGWRLLGRQSYLERAPRGVVAVISPWNYPFSIPMGEAVMALLAGNAVLLKPSRNTALVGEAIREVMQKAELPEGVFTVVQGSGSALVQGPVDFIAFTGSVATGKEIAALAGARLTPVMLELGGKDPMLVLADADLQAAARAAVWGAFTNSGQVCASVERVYVHASVSEEFIRLVVAETRRLKQGPGMDLATEVGPMINREQFEIVAGQVEDARQRGARILLGGGRHPDWPGYFYQPTVLTGVDHSFKIMQEETFGPVLPIMTFQTEDEAVQLANDSRYGLNAYIFTADLERGRRLARRLQAGTVMLNENLMTHALAETPWGGVKESGLGRTHGKYGLWDFTELKHVHIDRFRHQRKIWAFPYGRELYELLLAGARLLNPRRAAAARAAVGLWPRFRAWQKMIRRRGGQ